MEVPLPKPTAELQGRPIHRKACYNELSLKLAKVVVSVLFKAYETKQFIDTKSPHPSDKSFMQLGK